MSYVIPSPVTGNGKVQTERYQSVLYLMQIWYKSKIGSFYLFQNRQGDNGPNRIAYNNCIELYETLAILCTEYELKQLRKFIEMTYVTRTVGGKL